MQHLLRQLFAFLAAVTLVFFLSCERHKPEELAHGGHGKADAAGDEHAGGETGKHGDDHQHSADQHRAATAMSVTPPPGNPAPASTPAQFFPTPTPH